MHGDNIFTALSAFSSMFVDNLTAGLSVHHLPILAGFCTFLPLTIVMLNIVTVKPV